jgi:hypothetical protein
VCVIWAKAIPHSLKSATLCLGSLIVSPYVLGNDVCFLSISIAVAFLISDGISRGFLSGERVAVLICYIGLFLLLTPTVPIVPFICTMLLPLVARRIVAYERGLLPSIRPVLGRGEVCAPDLDAAREGVKA